METAKTSAKDIKIDNGKYEKLFCRKYSYYALLRRLHAWFVENKNRDEVKEGYEAFQKYASEPQKLKTEDKFAFRRLGMIFSNEFIENHFCNDSNNGMSKTMREERALNITNEKDPDKVSYQSANLETIFVRGAMGRKEPAILKSYLEIVRDSDKLAKEKERIRGLVIEWFQTDEVMKEVISEVITKYYLNRKFVSEEAVLNSQTKKDDESIDVFYIEDGFFRMLVKNRQKNSKKNAHAIIFSLSEFKNAFGEEVYSQVMKASGVMWEEKLQNLITLAFQREKFLSIEYAKTEDDWEDWCIVLKEDDAADSNEFIYAKMIKEKFDDIAEANPAAFIANIIITSLCIKEIDGVFKSIWNISLDDTVASENGDTPISLCLKKIKNPFANNNTVAEGLYELKCAVPDFYKGELSFLNIHVYRNWEILKRHFTDISVPLELLEYSYHYIKENLDSEKYEEFSDNYKKYLDAYEEYGIGSDLENTIYQFINSIIDDELEVHYAKIADLIEYLIGVSDERLKFLEAKLYKQGLPGEDTAYEQDLEEAYHLFCEVYADTKEDRVAAMILACLEGMEQEDVIDESPVTELKSMWNRIVLQNGDEMKIRDIFRQESLRKLENRKKEIEESSGIAFSISRLDNVMEPDVDTYDEYTFSDDYGEIFVVLGAGRAATAFIDSIRDREDSKIFLVLQHGELNLAQELREWYGESVEIIDGGLRGVYEKLELYNLYTACLEKECTFSYYKKYAAKIHILALGDDKHENIRNVIDFMETTWECYVLYNDILHHDVLYHDIADEKIGFEEVDIVVDAYDFETAYIDSIVNRLDEDFYLKIDYIDYKKEIVKELISEYPLFLIDMQEAKLNAVITDPSEFSENLENKFESGKSKHNVVIIGCEEQREKIVELVKGILRVSGYAPIPDDLEAHDKKKLKEYEQRIGSDFSLSIISKNADGIEQDLRFDAPDIFESDSRSYLHNVKPQFINADPEGYDFIRCFHETCQKASTEAESMERNVVALSKILRAANYFICMLQDDASSYRMATRIRQEGYRMDPGMKHVPVISALCENTFINTDINKFRVMNEDDGKEIVYRDPWWRNYDINCFGAFDRCFSYKNLYENYLNEISKSVHVKSGDTDMKMRAYYRNYYNHRAGDQRALTVPYAFFAVLYREMCYDCSLQSGNTDQEVSGNEWSLEIFKDNIERYAAKYNEAVLGENSKVLWLAVLEKNRFNMNLTLDGYTSVLGGTENREIFEVYMNGWKKRSTDAVLTDKLHIAKIHGDIVPWEYSKGQEYDSVYVREMGNYLLKLHGRNRLGSELDALDFKEREGRDRDDLLY